MTPRRRPLLLALTAAVAAAAVGLAVAADDQGTTLRRSAVAQDRPGPVLLVPGYGGGTTSLEALATVLRAHGREAVVVHLPDHGIGDLRAAAEAVDRAATAALAVAPSVDVVGYSAGGITARYWARYLGGSAKARRIVTLGSPHHGTDLARLGVVLGPAACATACHQLAPGSDLLEHLNDGDETPDGPQWMSLWSAGDVTVTPPTTSRLDGAVDVQLQDVCPGVAVDHGGLPSAPLVRGLLLRALGPAGLTAPTAADCTALTAEGG